MKVNTLGRTELPVTAMGLGLAALGRPGYINLGHGRDLQRDYDVAAMESHAHEVLDAAWAAGMRYFDAARSYGRAEAFLASWLQQRQIDPAEVTIGSKWGYTYTAGWQVEAEKHEVKEHTLPVLQRQIEESRQHLGNYLDMYQIHSATLDSGVLENKEVLRELGRLREEGLAIGLSLSGAQQADTLRKAMGIVIDGQPLFAAVQATWNLLEPSAGPVLQEAHEAGVGIIVKEALANGRLTARGLTMREGNPQFARRYDLLARLAGEQQTSIDALALAAVLAQPWVSVVLSGAAAVEQVRSNVHAFEVVWDDELMRQVATVAEPPTQYWETRNQLPWN